jgi:hypothetical protein
MCPVDVLVVNSDGQRLGVGPGNEYLAEFLPGDYYYQQDDQGHRQWFFALPAGEYQVMLTATDSGDMRVVTFTGDGDVRDYGSHPVNDGQRHKLTLEKGGDRLVLADGTVPQYRLLNMDDFLDEPTVTGMPEGIDNTVESHPEPDRNGISGGLVAGGATILIGLLVVVIFRLSRRR